MIGRGLAPILLLVLAVAATAGPSDQGANPDDRIGLADLSAYRAALSGRPTADDARATDRVPRVGFRDLWNRPEAFRGRRVAVVGRIQRRFRQAAVGSFPPLVEAWVFNESGDPLCLVYPRPEGDEEAKPGRMVRFTGTFLKTIRYTAGDGDRLAPLIVGNTPPGPSRVQGKDQGDTEPPANREPGTDDDRPARSDADQTLGIVLAVLVVLVIAFQMVRGAKLPQRNARHRRPRVGNGETDDPDPPLHFIDSPDDEP